MQRYLIDYQVYDQNWRYNGKLGAVATYNKYTFSKSSDKESVLRAINDHKEKNEIIMRAWAVEWHDFNARHKLVIGDPASSPSDPGTTFLRHVRAQSEKDKAMGEEGRRQLSLIPKTPVADAVLEARMIAHDKKIEEARKPVVHVPAVKMYQPYALPKAVELES